MRVFTVCLMLLFAVGCGASSEFEMVPVSGTITLDGQPLEGAEVVFAPKQIDKQAAVGPASIGTTDAAGNYMLKTTKGLEGAVVGEHKVAVRLNKLDESAIAAKADKAFADNKDITQEELRAIRREARESMMNKKTIHTNYNDSTTLSMKVEAPTESANFDLKSDGT